MLNISIKTVPNNTQRYNTIGDYETDNSGEKTIKVSDMGNSRYELLVAIHELIESSLCDVRGIDEASVDAFDMQFEKDRSSTDIASEPGDDDKAPYNKEHVFATKVEKMLADELNVDWQEYNEACRSFTKEYLEQKQ